jgi:hypothetical protein
MKLEAHIADSLRLLGKPFEEIHRWLDEFAGTPEYGFRHRRKRHHLKGIEEVRKMFGDEAAEAACEHIKADLREEGWRDGTDRIPKDEEDYRRMGLL